MNCYLNPINFWVLRLDAIGYPTRQPFNQRNSLAGNLFNY
jgi:hypothetical protein